LIVINVPTDSDLWPKPLFRVVLRFYSLPVDSAIEPR